MNPWLWRIGMAVGASATVGIPYWRFRAARALRPRSTDHLFPEPLTIMGHRGAAAAAPENTMAAFAVSSRLRLPFELDVQLCQSGEVVVLHDESLDRTTNGQGLVAQTPWSAIRAMDAGRWFDPPFVGQRVPSLDAVLATLGGTTVINIEIKSPPHGARAAETKAKLVRGVATLIRAHDLVDRVMISSFDPEVLALVRGEEPNLRRGYIVNAVDERPLYARTLAPTGPAESQAQPDLLMANRRLITDAFVARMKARGLRVFTWTVNDVDEANRVADAGVDGIITDDPERLVHAFSPRTPPFAAGFPA